MIKRTLYIDSPAYLSLRQQQFVYRLPGVPDALKKEAEKTAPIEDIGVVILDHQRITVSQGLIEALLDNKVAVISCDSTHHPHGLLLPLCGNTLQQERFSSQIAATVPLKNALWQQVIRAKIMNQAHVLREIYGVLPYKRMSSFANEVVSGDKTNREAQAAAFYWKRVFKGLEGFSREREGVPPNNLLNYGYAILRAVVARALVVSGLLPTFGIHHHNRYNAYCLADDVMEPYRPFVDQLVLDIMHEGWPINELSKDIKQRLLQVPTLDVMIGKKRNPLMIAVAQTTASLNLCFEGKLRKLKLPTIM